MMLTLQCRSCFFLGRIPLELRYQIYEYTVDAKAIFDIGYDCNVYQDKDREGFRECGMPWESNVVNPACLSYKVSTFTPLLLVCKQVSNEVQYILRALPNPNYWMSDITSAITAPELRRLILDGTPFGGLWERSRFEITIGPSVAMDFLTSFPRSLRYQVRSLVFRRRSLNLARASNNSCFGWQKKSTGHSQCALFLRKKLLGLREIAIWVPAPGYFPMAHYPDSAPLEMVKLLREGIVDVVRFLYADGDPSILTRCKWLRRARFPDKSETSSEGTGESGQLIVATLEELLDADTGKPLKQTAESPFNVYPDANMVVALRRKPAEPREERHVIC